MATIILHGVITSDGLLEFDMPEGLTPGPVEIEIRQPELQGITLGEVLNSGMVGMWSDRSDIEDSVECARKLRRRALRRDDK